MIYGVVGTLDQNTMMKFGLYNMKTGRFQRVASKKGNGKTLVITYYGYKEFTDYKRKVFSNYHTTFSTYRPAQEVFDDLGRLLDLAGKYGGYGTITDIIKTFDHIFAHNNLTKTQMAELYELRALYLEYYGALILLTEFQKFFNSLGTSTKTIKWVEGILTQLRKIEVDLMWDSQRPVSAGNRSREYTETFLVPQKVHTRDLTPCDKDICDEDHLIYVYSDIPFREKELVVLVASEVGKLYDTNEIIGDNLCFPSEKQDEDKAPKRKGRQKKEQPEPEPVPVISNRPDPEEEPDPEIIDQISYVPLDDEPEPVTVEADNPFYLLLHNPRVPDVLKEVARAKMDSLEQAPPDQKDTLIREYLIKLSVVNDSYPPQDAIIHDLPDSTGNDTISPILSLMSQFKDRQEDPLMELYE